MIVDSKTLQTLYATMAKLDMTDNAIKLYLMALQLGPTSISTLADKLHIARPNAYKVINELKEKGLTTYPNHALKSKRFVVDAPTRILEILREKKKEMAEGDNFLTNIMPGLLSIYHQGDNPSTIKILTGRNDFINVFQKILEEANGSGEFFGSAQDFVNFVSWDVEKKWMAKRVEKGVMIRVLLLPSEFGDMIKKNDKKEKRETRVLKGIAPFVTSFQIFANKLILWQPKVPMAIVIEDEYFVRMFIAIFNFMWEVSGTTSEK